MKVGVCPPSANLSDENLFPSANLSDEKNLVQNKNVGTMTQLLDAAQEECSVRFLWTSLVAALALKDGQL